MDELFDIRSSSLKCFTNNFINRITSFMPAVKTIIGQISSQPQNRKIRTSTTSNVGKKLPTNEKTNPFWIKLHPSKPLVIRENIGLE